MHRNLQHVVTSVCGDPDCELHHPDVGIEEGTVSETDLAFFLAGAQMARAAILRHYAVAPGREGRQRLLNAALIAETEMLGLANRDPVRPDWLYAQ